VSNQPAPLNALGELAQSASLTRLETACRLLAEARLVDEVRSIRDVAEAARVYAREVRLGLEAQNDAAEIKLRAERRLGELLADAPLQNGGDAARARSHATEVRPRLRDLGISKSQSSRWQALAALPEPVFDSYIAGARDKGRRDGSTELTTAGALTVARQSRPPYTAPPSIPHSVQLSGPDRFDVADAAALPWPDSSVDLFVTSPPYALDIDYKGGDVETYARWLQLLEAWLREMSRVSRAAGGRLCLNVPLDRDRGGWEPVSADVVQAARATGWQFRTWLLWDKGQAGAGTDRGSLDSASAPNVTAAVESVLVFYRGQWRRAGPVAVPHADWLELCGPRGVWRFPGTSDPYCAAPFPEELPRRCITLFSFPDDVVADPFCGRGTTLWIAARLGRTAWAADRDADAISQTRARVAQERAALKYESSQLDAS
jgi:site-specific DNA-methyltransferase (adenine-specific)